MALSTFKCNCLTPVHFKGLKLSSKHRSVYTVSCSVLCWLGETDQFAHHHRPIHK